MQGGLISMCFCTSLNLHEALESLFKMFLVSMSIVMVLYSIEKNCGVVLKRGSVSIGLNTMFLQVCKSMVHYGTIKVIFFEKKTFPY